MNPEAAWPQIEALASTCSARGFALAPRLPIYPAFVNERFVAPAMLAVLERFADSGPADGAGTPSVREGVLSQ